MEWLNLKLVFGTLFIIVFLVGLYQTMSWIGVILGIVVSFMIFKKYIHLLKFKIKRENKSKTKHTFRVIRGGKNK